MVKGLRDVSGSSVLYNQSLGAYIFSLAFFGKYE